jgi:predicted transcriptional regulator
MRCCATRSGDRHARPDHTTPALSVADEQQFLAAVEAGKQALRDGRLLGHEAVVAAFNWLVRPLPYDPE